MTSPTLRRATPDDLDGLVDLLLDVVETGGASVGFLSPLSRERAARFWRGALEAGARGERVVLVALDADARLVGTVQLVLDLPDNQPHRADVAKMQVHSRARQRGLGAALLAAIEEEARAAGRSVLVLDTVTGSPAERLYARHGWQRVGVIPDYAQWPDGRPCDSTFFYKRLPSPAPSRR